VIQDLPQAARQVGHAESIDFRNLPAAQLGSDAIQVPKRTHSIPGLSLANLPATPADLPLSARRPDFEAQDSSVQGGSTAQGAVQELEQLSSETWWRGEVAHPFCGLPQNEPLDLGTLIQLTLRGSPHLQAISQEPLVRDEDATIARADFDPVLFARTLYDDRTDPVGNTLTTGGLPFLKDNIWTGQAGIRRKYFTGGKLEASQLLGFQNSNSRFFVPQDQGTATLAINLQQPLLRGAGQTYNRSQIVIAQLNAGASWDQVAGRIQDELARAVASYWDLYAKRAIYLQMLRNLERSEAILKRLEARAEYDVQALQLAQARAAVTSRRVQLANALRDVRNAETEIRQIVGDAQLIDSDQIELLTVESPQDVVEPLELPQTVEVALANRPEIREAMNKLKAAAVRNDVTRNEMLPDLSLLFGTYVKGLKGDSALGQAWEQQFVNSTPGYSAGLQYEFPWRNRAAISRNRQNRLEYVRYQNELERATISVIAETQKSFRTLNSGIETLASAQVALDAVLAELKQLEVRWDAFPLVEGDWFEGQTQSLLLDQLLAAQQKVNDHEREVTMAELELKTAQINLKRAMGIVLDYYQVSTETALIDGLPQVEYNAGGAGQQPWSSLPSEDGATAPIKEIK
jgi:outer membrane protein TolC